MSRRKKPDDILESDLIVADSNQTDSAEPTEFNNSKTKRLPAYLKTHWRMIALIAFLAVGAAGAGLKYLEQAALNEKENDSRAASEQNKSLLSSINPFSAAPVVSPSPTLSKEYIYAGSRMLAVVDAGADDILPADLAYWRPSTGVWYIVTGASRVIAAGTLGSSGDAPAPGDYDGDGKTDFAVWRPSNGYWYIVNSSDSSQINFSFGVSGDKTAPADYDGDGRTDAAVYRPSNGTWYVKRSSDSGMTVQQYGLSNDTPAPGDYDGDGKADYTVWQNNNTFFTLRSSDGISQQVAMGQAGDVPVCADYDGDKKADYALKRANQWIIRYSSSGQTQPAVTWEQAADTPVQNDYDGDGKVDIAVWRYSARLGYWYIRNSSTGLARVETTRSALADDIPVPAFYRR